jgi:hypothetical protein
MGFRAPYLARRGTPDYAASMRRLRVTVRWAVLSSAPIVACETIAEEPKSASSTDTTTGAAELADSSGSSSDAETTLFESTGVICADPVEAGRHVETCGVVAEWSLECGECYPLENLCRCESLFENAFAQGGEACVAAWDEYIRCLLALGCDWQHGDGEPCESELVPPLEEACDLHAPSDTEPSC